MVDQARLRFVRIGLFKLGLAVVSAIALQLIFDLWVLTALLMLHIFVHEQGHLWAMRRCGLKIRGFYFIPVLGAVALAEKGIRHPSRQAEFTIALMGPAWGMVLSLLSLLVYGLWGEQHILGRFGLLSALLGGFINLTNLIPLPLLDGGIAFRSLFYSLRSGKALRNIVILGLIAQLGLVSWLLPSMLPVLLWLAPVGMFVLLSIGAWWHPMWVEQRAKEIRQRYDSWRQDFGSDWVIEHFEQQALAATYQPIREYPAMSRRGIRWSGVSFLTIAGLLLATMLASIRIITPFIEQNLNQNQAAGDDLDVTIPGVEGASYRLGLADRFAGYTDISVACREWRQLNNGRKLGLTFVDETVVPKCADSEYAQEAQAAHQATERPDIRKAGQTLYYQLGAPAEVHAYMDSKYSCKDIQDLVQQNIAPMPEPRPSDKAIYGSRDDPEWQAYKQKREEWANLHSWVNYAWRLYELGGHFPEGCYPPAAVFDKDDEMRFYPNRPVNSLRESAAPVFTSPGGSTVIGVGTPYTVRNGDTLGKLADCFYGWSGNWDILAFSNEIKEVTKLQVGQVIRIPDVKDTSSCYDDK